MEYLVTWTIDISADSPEEAAEIAREFQLRPDSLATVFVVHNKDTHIKTRVDLLGD